MLIVYFMVGDLRLVVFLVFRSRRPPRSTLFPYTRSSDLLGDGSELFHEDVKRLGHEHPVQRRQQLDRVFRSEEHTSELQSLTNLVCRLLLEKKKRQTRKGHRTVGHADNPHNIATECGLPP